MRKAVFSTLVLVLLAPLFASLATIGSVNADGSGIEILDYYWGQAGEEWAAIPGDRNVKLTMVIQNKEDTTICGLRAKITGIDSWSPFPFRGKDGGQSIASYYPGSMRVGEAGSIEFDVSIVPDAEPGEYQVYVYFEYLNCEDPDYPTLSSRSTVSLKVWRLPEIKVLDTRWVDQDGSPTQVGPGSYAKFLQVTLYVPRFYSISNVKAVLHLSKYFTNLTGGSLVEEFSHERAVGGQPLAIRFGLNVREDAPIGVHRLKLSLRYYDRWLSEVEQEIDVPVKVSGVGELDIGYQGVLMSAGSSKVAEVTLRNEGTAPIYSVKSRIVAEMGLIVLAETTKEVDVLLPGESTVLRPLVFAPPTLAEGSYTLTLTVTYVDSSGVKRTETRGIGVYVRPHPEMGLTAYVLGDQLTASRTAKVRIVLKNLYDSKVTEVRTLLSFRGVPIVAAEGDQTAYFPEIRPGESVEIPVDLLVSPRAEETVYEGSMTVYYRDPLGQPRTTTLSIPLVVKGLIELSFKEVQVGPSTAYPGSTVDVLGEILNRGTATARLTTVKLILEDPMIPTQYSSYYIGDVSPYSTSSFTLSFRVSDDAKPGTYRVKIVAEAENTFGDKIESSSVIELQVAERPMFESRPPAGSQQTSPSAAQLTLASVAIAAISAAIIYLGARRRRKSEAH